MHHQSADKPVRVTGEERLHPALRRLARACIALVRWQRAQAEQPTTKPGNDSDVDPQDTSQDRRHG
ncbi:MAG: hypothetical protein ACR2GH_15370 [Pseudonocardia sp.]